MTSELRYPEQTINIEVNSLKENLWLYFRYF